VLGFDPSLLKQLLSDETVPRDIRDKIEKLRRIISTYPQLRIKKRSVEEE
jgi:uncharacterized protein (UPF0147 family)